MSNPCVAPREALMLSTLDRMPDGTAPFTYQGKDETGVNDWDRMKKRLKDLDYLKAQIAELDMEPAQSFVLPMVYCADKNLREKKGLIYGQSKTGAMAFRRRTIYAKDATHQAYVLLPPEVKEMVRERAKGLVMADGGTPYCLGRLLKAYPKRGSHISLPITRAEARVEWEAEVGNLITDPAQWLMYTTEEERRRVPFFKVTEDSEGVMTNHKAGNGFPVLGKGTDPEAMETCARMTLALRTELEAAYVADAQKGVQKWYDAALKERPWLVALQGKAKGDYIDQAKAERLEMRFYNAMGRCAMMNIQTATQRLEQLATSVLQGVGQRSASGVPLVRGGALAIVEALERQLDREGHASTRMGDDSWVMMIIREWFVQFALDASNFDLTQHGELTAEVHAELLRLLMQIDPIAAQLLYAFQRNRLVALFARLAVFMKHAGPSGLPMQSKVNGVIMGVAIRRAVAGIEAKYEEGDEKPSAEEVGRILAEVGRGMGIVIKLEQFSCREVPDAVPSERLVRHFLEEEPFLYLGYYFYNEEGVISVHADLPRSLCQMRYPTLKWVEDRGALRALEAGRLASTLLAWGRPLIVLRPTFEAMRTSVLMLIEEELQENGDRYGAQLRAATMQSAQEDGAERLTISLPGVARALRRNWDHLWVEDGQEVDLVAQALVPATGFDERGAQAALLPGGGLEPIDLMVGKIVPPSRPPTTKNAGRNPSTKVFGPPKAPKLRDYRAHENAGWSRLGAPGTEEDQEERAEEYARMMVEEEEAAREVLAEERRLRLLAEEAAGDFFPDETEDERFGHELDSEETEQWLTFGQWATAPTAPAP